MQRYPTSTPEWENFRRRSSGRMCQADERYSRCEDRHAAAKATQLRPTSLADTCEANVSALSSRSPARVSKKRLEVWGSEF